MIYKRRIKLQTFPCPLCGSPNRIEHDGSLLLIPGVCKSFGKQVEFNNQRMLFGTIIGSELVILEMDIGTRIGMRCEVAMFREVHFPLWPTF